MFYLLILYMSMFFEDSDLITPIRAFIQIQESEY